MSASSASTTTAKASRLRNPVAIKELRGRMRGRRAFVLLTIYLVLMSAFIMLVFAAFSASGPSTLNLRQMGKYVFAAVIAVQIFLVVIIGPALTASAISGEKERKTYDLLKTTLLPARAVVAGKMLSALSYVFLLVIVSIPIQSMAFLMGGITPSEIILAELVIFVCAIAYALIGLFMSALARSTLIASVATYALVFALTIGLPVIAGGVTILRESIIYGPTSPSPSVEILFSYLLLAMAVLNLPGSLVVSDIFLMDHGSLLGYWSTTAYRSSYIFSPWYLTIIFYTILGLLLFYLTVRQVRRIEM